MNSQVIRYFIHLLYVAVGSAGPSKPTSSLNLLRSSVDFFLSVSGSDGLHNNKKYPRGEIVLYPYVGYLRPVVD